MSPRLPAQQSLTLQCLAQGKPVPQMRWTLNGTALTHSTPGITVASDSTFIQINNVSLSDKGVYTCYAENVAGSDNLMYNVDVVRKLYLKKNNYFFSNNHCVPFQKLRLFQMEEPNKSSKENLQSLSVLLRDTQLHKFLGSETEIVLKLEFKVLDM